MTTEPNKPPTLDDVIVRPKTFIPDHREHGKEPKHLDEDELDARTDQERSQTRDR